MIACNDLNLCIFDVYWGHLVDYVKERERKKLVLDSVILRGRTSPLQVMDVTI